VAPIKVARSSGDHVVMIVALITSEKGYKPFRIYDSWLVNEDFVSLWPCPWLESTHPFVIMALSDFNRNLKGLKLLLKNGKHFMRKHDP